MRVGKGVGQAMPTWVAAYVHDTTSQLGTYLCSCTAYVRVLPTDGSMTIGIIRVGVRVCMCDECRRSCCELCVVITLCACVYGRWAHSDSRFSKFQGFQCTCAMSLQHVQVGWVMQKAGSDADHLVSTCPRLTRIG